jgi:hypothetical protein
VADDSNPVIPFRQQDHPVGTVLSENTIYQMEIRDAEGRWSSWLTPDADRYKLTRIQAHRLSDPEHRGERRRVIEQVTILRVHEVEGDGEGETSAEELLARNAEATKRLLESDEEPNDLTPHQLAQIGHFTDPGK